MHSTIVTSVFVTPFLFLYLFWVKPKNSFKKGYFQSVNFWARALPLLSILSVALLIGANLANGYNLESWKIIQYFTTPELIVLFLASPMLLTKNNNFIALIMDVYVVYHLNFLEPPIQANPGLLVLIASTTVIAVLGDQLPWLHKEARNSFTQKLREILLVFLSFASIALIFIVLLNPYHISRWFNYTFAINMTPSLSMLLLIGLAVGWSGIILGMSRYVILPLLCIPTLAIFSFVSTWPSHILILPYLACISLALASINRRQRIRRT